MDHALTLKDEATTTNAETPMADEFAKPEAMAARE
jgi:hypothetical protein